MSPKLQVSVRSGSSRRAAGAAVDGPDRARGLRQGVRHDHVGRDARSGVGRRDREPDRIAGRSTLAASAVLVTWMGAQLTAIVAVAELFAVAAAGCVPGGHRGGVGEQAAVGRVRGPGQRTVTEAPGAEEAKVHSRRALTIAQPWTGGATLHATPAGRSSTIVTSVAVPAPPLLTSMAYAASSPAEMVPFSAALRMVRSGQSARIVAVEVLFAALPGRLVRRPDRRGVAQDAAGGGGRRAGDADRDRVAGPEAAERALQLAVDDRAALDRRRDAPVHPGRQRVVHGDAGRRPGARVGDHDAEGRALPGRHRPFSAA